MLEDIKKGLLAGFGSVLLTKDKVEEATKKLVEQAKLSREDAQKLTDELVELGEKRWSEVENAVTEVTRKGLDSLDVCRQSELTEVKKRLESLENRLAEIEGKK
jgi:polyhydroxyalkanoate synthesis regulator phasin